MLHESQILDNITTTELINLAKTHEAIRTISVSNFSVLQGIVEHVSLSKILDAIAADNPGVLSGKGSFSTAQYQRILNNSIEKLSRGENLVKNPYQNELITSDGMVISKVDKFGNVDYYVNEEFDVVNVSGDYSESFLQGYGIETAHENGSITGRATLGGHLRAFADLIGLDGQFGIQGNFARADEGTANNGVRPAGDGGAIGRGINAAGNLVGGALGTVFDPISRGLDKIFGGSGSASDGPKPTNASNGNASKSRAYDQDGNPQNEGRGYGGKNSSKTKEEWDDLFDNIGDDKPIILDLNDDGIQITELSKSTMFVDATGDGLLNRTAWAGAGNGVLFYDANGDGLISEKREYVFTEWDPTATSDMEALASVFDSNGDGVFDANDDAWADFKVLVTNADGSYTAKTLDELGITSIDLTADATNIELPDGSVITGKTTFTWDDGTTGTVADTTLVAESAGHRIEKAVSTNAAGNRVEVSTGYNADGSNAFVLTAETSPDGLMITNSLDRNGDGVVDVIQTIATVVNADGSKVETVTNKAGADAATAVLTSQTVTSTSADGSVVTIERDSLGGGWFDQVEIRTTHADDSMTIVVMDRSSDGSIIRQVTETVSADGLIRSEAIDQDGDGGIDLTINHVIVVNGDSSRSETITHLNNDGSTRNAVTETVSADGKVKTIARNVDGDGDTDTLEETSITVNADGSTSSVVNVKNGDGSLRSSVTQDQTADALTKTTTSDVDGDGDVDLTAVDQTVINADGSRVQTVTATNTDGSVNGMSKTTLGADKVTSQTWVDLNQNGVFEATDLVQDISVDTVSGERTAVSYSRSADGSVNATQTSVTAADGLTTITTIDADGDGDTDSTINDVTVNNADGSTTRTVTTRNGDNSLRSEVTTVTSADGLTTTVETDRDGDGQRDNTVTTVSVVNAGGSTTTTREAFAGNGTTLLSRSVTDVSADRKVTTVTTDRNGDGHTDQTVTSTESDLGHTYVVTTDFAANGTQISKDTLWNKANGLYSIAKHWIGASATEDFIARTNIDLLANGGTQVRNTIKNQNDSNVSWQQVTTSDDGLVQTTEVDADWNGVKERTTTSTTVLNADGSTETTTEVENAIGQVMSRSQSETSDDGLTQITRSDADGDGDYDLVTTSTTTLLNDGGRSTVTELRELDGTLRSSTTSTISDDGRQSTVSQDVNGDGNIDSQITRSVADDGVVTEISSHFDSTGGLQSRTQNITSANGLHVTSSVDADGNGVFEMTSESLTVLNADGSRTTTLSEKSADGNIWRQTVTTISADGLTKTTATDLDFDGTADFTTTVSSSLAADGVETISTTTTSADGSTISTDSRVISADQRTITEMADTDGNGHNDWVKTTTIGNDGKAAAATRYNKDNGSKLSTSEATISGDGQTRTGFDNRDGIWGADVEFTETTVHAADGTDTIIRNFHKGSGTSNLGKDQLVRSADGLTSTRSLDLDGNNVFESVTQSTTSFASNGDVTRQTTTRDHASNLMSDVTIVTSGNGLVTTRNADIDGDGNVDQTDITTRSADGGQSAINSEFGPGATLQRKVTDTLSADGRTRNTTVDLDGDGNVDRKIDTLIDLDRATTTTWTDLSDAGSNDAAVTRVQAANGTQTSESYDIDGDGTGDINRTSSISYDASGNRIDTFTETYGGTTTWSETRTSAANGLSATTTIDADGDGVTDATTQETTTINADGSTGFLNETHYADGTLRNQVTRTTSYDQREITETSDYDGNGFKDKETVTVIGSDGRSTATTTVYDKAGVAGQSAVVTTTADGLLTTVVRGSVTETTTYSAVGNGSYDWSNGVTATATDRKLDVSHETDAAGITTWKMTSVLDGVTTSFEARLDGATLQRLHAEAARLYDTLLDRDMQMSEREALVEHISDGQLDGQALATALMATDEFTTRYGTLSDAAFISQIYLNTLGRTPELDDVNDAFQAFEAGTLTREDLAVTLAQSSEHLVVGNTHMSTNNFDVLLNPIEFERSLDKTQVVTIISRITDTLYDRDPTQTELDVFSDRLLTGVDTADDVAALMLAMNGDIVPANPKSLFGLSGAALVQQAFLNALGRQPTASELAIWEDNLVQGRLTAAEFTAILARSVDHKAVGNTHAGTPTAGPATIVGDETANTLNGTSGSEILIGDAGNDTLLGGDGNDILIGGEGADVLDGGAGIDTASYALARSGLWIKLHNEAGRTGEAAGDTLLNIENLVGSTYDDTINGNDSDNVIHGMDGDDNIYGHDGNDTIYLGHGDDVGTGGNGRDIINGGSGDDNIFGGKHNDRLYGDNGNDRLFGDIGKDTLYGGNGDDLMRGGGWKDTLYGEDGNDTLYGDAGHDTLYGGAGNDFLQGGVGNDVMTGGNGDDVFLFRANSKVDRVTDYSVSDDTMKFERLTFGDLTITQNGSDAVITYGNNAVLTLDDVLASDLVEAEFLFS